MSLSGKYMNKIILFLAIFLTVEVDGVAQTKIVFKGKNARIYSVANGIKTDTTKTPLHLKKTSSGKKKSLLSSSTSISSFSLYGCTIYGELYPAIGSYQTYSMDCENYYSISDWIISGGYAVDFGGGMSLYTGMEVQVLQEQFML